MKKKEHVQRFASSFFLSLDNVEESLRVRGHVDTDEQQYQAVLRGDMRCHRCGAESLSNGRKFTATTMIEHFQRCEQPYSGPDAVRVPTSM